MAVEAELFDSSSNVIASIIGHDDDNGNNWAPQITLSFTTDSTTTRLRLTDVSTGIDASDCILDNVAVIPLFVPMSPAIVSQPTNVMVLEGSAAGFAVTATGTDPLNYQWLLNGVPLSNGGEFSGSSTTNLLLTDTTTNDVGEYTVIITNAYGSVTSLVATLSFVFPPSICSQPLPQTNEVGASFTLGLLASGTTPLAYQWQNSSGPILGATNATLAFSPAQTNNSDNYFVVVTNAYGSVTSSVAPVFVYQPVEVLTQPSNLVVPAYAPATFSVTASGFPDPTSFQWILNGTNLAGATSSTLTIANAGLVNAGSYQVLIGNGYSEISSDFASLNIAPTILLPFTGSTNIFGRDATISVLAYGSGALTYQWYFNGVAIGGATLPIIVFPSIQFTNAGFYSLVVNSPYGAVTNVPAQLTVIQVGYSFGFYPGLTLSGAVEQSYIIFRSNNLADTNATVTMTNLTLTSTNELWVDTSVDASSPINSQFFYWAVLAQ